MSQTRNDAVVIGAGPSGLAAAFSLKMRHIPYILLEGSHRVANSWHYVWPEFKLAQPIQEVIMPGLDLGSKFSPNYHLKRDEIITTFEDYAEEHQLNIIFNVSVTTVQKDSTGLYQIKTANGDYSAANVIFGIGARQEPKYPTFLDEIPEDIRKQKVTHSAWYQGYRDFPPSSSIFIIGSGMSALGLAEELATATTQNYTVSLGCVYKDEQIRKNNKHLKSVTSLETLKQAGVKIIDEMSDIQIEVTKPNHHKIICATGYKTSYSLLNKLLSRDETPEHKNGVTSESGLYMVGLPSAGEKTVTITKGGEEAEIVASHIHQKTLLFASLFPAPVTEETTNKPANFSLNVCTP